VITIGKLARRFGVSRSTLLYYDSIGLLSPSGRTEAGYRVYTDRETRRLEQIRTYRAAGIPLTEIREILAGKPSRLAAVLERRLRQLNDEIAGMREQQRVVLGLLKRREHLRTARAIDKERWVELLRATGLGEEDMDRWHVEFERMSPEAHQDFLESLGIPPAEVEDIRAWSRERRSYARAGRTTTSETAEGGTGET
jgi:DNA-binding transcriptional MerR regulator